MFSKLRTALSSAISNVADLGNANEVTGDVIIDKKPERFNYNRPSFLKLNSEEVCVSADHSLRPIIVPRNAYHLPGGAGYAEVINAGKSLFNEDQAHAEILNLLEFCNSSPHGNVHLEKNNSSVNEDIHISGEDSLGYYAIFDGHAGVGASSMAVNVMHHHVLREVKKVIHLRRIARSQNSASEVNLMSSIYSFLDISHLISEEDLIKGAVEQAFYKMDEQIKEERLLFEILGGCTALVVLFYLNKIFICNAGDCRAVLLCNNEIIQLSNDHTPEYDKKRIKRFAYDNPHLLQNDFTCDEFSKKLTRKDVGKNVMYRNGWMKGWTYKTITEDDLKFPIIYGDGKKARVLATIGVTRGLGDHDLRVFDSSIYVKPFLSCFPEIQVFNMNDHGHTSDDVLIMASDGLWDVVANEDAKEIVQSCFKQFHDNDPKRYTSAAQDLVMHARGTHSKRWKTLEDKPASVDDISCFVIPISNFCRSYANKLLSQNEFPTNTF